MTKIESTGDEEADKALKEVALAAALEYQAEAKANMN